jgi:hypothetical protein
MRITSVKKPKKYKKSPNTGDLQFKIKFAIFPVRINETTLVWLEKYIVIYEYGVIGYDPYNRIDHRNKKIFGWGIKGKNFYNE